MQLSKEQSEQLAALFDDAQGFLKDIEHGRAVSTTALEEVLDNIMAHISLAGYEPNVHRILEVRNAQRT